MTTDETISQALKTTVIERASNPGFRHHEWFVKFHLEIMEHIARELCDIYTDADPLRVNNLVWLHDYEKIVDFDNEHNSDMTATRELMREVGFSPEAIDEIVAQIIMFNAKQDLIYAPIEIQIVSSADGASHLVGPFVATYWHEHPEMSVADLQAENTRKFTVDWEKKITLPEVKAAFTGRRQHLLELTGQLPNTYLS